jgi:hypothetical protein
MAMWREHLFATISRNSSPAAIDFDLPLPQTIVVGHRDRSLTNPGRLGYGVEPVAYSDVVPLGSP